MGTKLELTWVGKEDSFAVEPRILLYDEEKSYGEQDTENMLIHGDNLLALKALEEKYSGQVKCIYIDPPYNTGAAFEHYDDNLEHSIWLDLMKKRLEILKNLLADDGFFCIQIDDSEGHYLKVLLDEIFLRKNYLTTFYIQVRYSNKTLAEDSDYQKVIEQCHVYAKDKQQAKLNRPTEEYDLSKFTWKVTELEAGEKLVLGGKEVEIFKKNQYKIEKVESSIDCLKETWATGSLARVKASAGEFFELYLSERKSIDGLSCLYKVAKIGEDGLGYRYISGPKKATAQKGKFYSGVPLKRRKELAEGKSIKHKPVSNFYDFSASFGNCRLEGDVSFRGGKKPEELIQMVLEYFSNEGDLVLDSFLGSGTTAAVAHKMNRKYIGVEFGEHCYSLCKPRLDRVIDGDKTGISKKLEWEGGGGYKFYELAATLINFDSFGEPIINKDYSPEMLATTVALHEGFDYQPDQDVFWKQSQSTEGSFLFVTTKHLDKNFLDSIHQAMGEKEFLAIACKSFDDEIKNCYRNISIKKIPEMLLSRCEYDVENYNFNIVEPQLIEGEEESDE